MGIPAILNQAFRSLFTVGYIHDYKDTVAFGAFQYDFVTDFFVGQNPGQGR